MTLGEQEVADQVTGLTASRYGNRASGTEMSPSDVSITDSAKVGPAVSKLRQQFAKDVTLPKAWRINQLKQMLKMMQEGRSDLQSAMFKDLGKSAHECDLTEIDFVVSEIKHTIKHLSSWMKPKGAKLPLVNLPGKGETVHDPLGVVLVMGAWNYPVLLTLSPLVGAISAGNCCVVKPGSYSPETSRVMCRLIDQYLDRDCIICCEGNRSVTEALLAVKFDMIFFTGSGFVGKLIAKAAAEHLCPVVLELGGKSPLIVEKSANLDIAAMKLAWAAFLNSGQTCVRPDFVLVDASVADKFLSLVKTHLKRMYTDDPQQCNNYGRIINVSAFDRLKQMIDDCGDFVVHGGRSDRSDKFIEPTLIDYGTDFKAFESSPAMQDENFGPVLPIFRYGNLEEDVIQYVRNLPTGKPLALYLFSQNKSVIEEVTRRTTSGGMCVNDAVMQLICPDLPFGGVGNSGMGSYHGIRSFQCFSHEKAVLTKYPSIEKIPGLRFVLSARYPPFTSTKKNIAKTLTT